MNWQLLAGGAAVAFAVGGYSGMKLGDVFHQHEMNKRDEAVAKAHRERDFQLERVRLLQDATNKAIEQRDAARRESQKVEYKERIKEVIKYVKSPDAGKCELPVDFVHIHDAAAAPGMPEAPEATSGNHGASAGEFTDSDLIPVLVENYDTYHVVKNRLLACQEFAGSLVDTSGVLTQPAE